MSAAGEKVAQAAQYRQTGKGSQRYAELDSVNDVDGRAYADITQETDRQSAKTGDDKKRSQQIPHSDAPSFPMVPIEYSNPVRIKNNPNLVSTVTMTILGTGSHIFLTKSPAYNYIESIGGGGFRFFVR
jgi:hypothetical protein